MSNASIIYCRVIIGNKKWRILHKATIKSYFFFFTVWEYLSMLQESIGSKFFLEVIIFGLARFFLKKITKLIFFKNWNRFKPTGFDSVQFFRKKTSSNWFGSVLARFFPVWFSVWLSFFQVWLGFFRFRFGLVFSVLDL